MPGGIPGTAPMSMSILYSYMPSFILPFSASSGLAANALAKQDGAGDRGGNVVDEFVIADNRTSSG